MAPAPRVQLAERKIFAEDVRDTVKNRYIRGRCGSHVSPFSPLSSAGRKGRSIRSRSLVCSVDDSIFVDCFSSKVNSWTSILLGAKLFLARRSTFYKNKRTCFFLFFFAFRSDWCYTVACWVCSKHCKILCKCCGWISRQVQV